MDRTTNEGGGLVQVRSWLLDCSNPNSLVLRFSGISEGALVNLGDRDGRFIDSQDGVVLLDIDAFYAGAGESLLQYLRLGFEHILSGWDHLLFVLLLCLLSTGWRLIKLVTAFTFGHSITLALAALGFVSVAGPAVEACIALSIMFLAREVVAAREGLSHGFLIVTAFGLLHGLGFAGALVEAGLPPLGVTWALLGFNLGVELGQLVFVAAVFLVLSTCSRLGVNAGLVQLSAWAAGVLGAYWTITRLASM